MVEKINKHGLSRQIPVSVKREVGRRCGFGCVVCGVGIIRYEHFDPPFGDAKAHDAEGITVLCPSCHLRKSTDLAFGETIAACHRSPRKQTEGAAGTLRDITAEDPVVRMGSNRFVGVGHLMVIDDEAVLSFRPRLESGAPLRMSVRFVGEDGGHSLKIIDNEWIAADAGWDIETTDRAFTFRNAACDLILSFTLYPPDAIEVHAYRFKKNTGVLDVNTESITFSEPEGQTYVIRENHVSRSVVGLHLVTDKSVSTCFSDTVANMTEDHMRECRYLIQPTGFYEDD